MLSTYLLPLIVATAMNGTSAPAQSATPTAASTPTPPTAAAAAPYAKPAPPGRLVDIGGRRLHVECKGPAGGPTVVFEAGLSQYTAHGTYGKAQDLIAAFAHVCTYDRAGLGWSDPAHGARTHQVMVADLHALAAADGWHGPFVLVGHSIGGLLARLYAATYPDQVAAIVLVDATPEAYLYTPAAVQGRKDIVAQIDTGLSKAKGDLPIVPFPAGTPAEVMMAFTPPILRTVKEEYLAIDRVPAARRVPGGYGRLGDMPLVVIRRGKTANPPSEEDLRWRRLQEGLAGLSSNSRTIVATQSGHVVPYEAPDVVADAVRQVIDRLRSSREARDGTPLNHAP